MHLTNWKARRAGPAMTITGTGHKGEPIKLTGIREIAPVGGGARHIEAIGADGFTHTLSID